MDILSNFVDNLTELMFDNKMNVKNFCEKLDIGLSECYRCLRKENLPTFATVIKIADYFCCSIDYLLGLAPYLSEDKLNYTPPFNIAFAKILKEYKVTRYQLNKLLKELAFKYSVTPNAIAAAWLLKHPAGFAVINGTTQPERVRQIAKAKDIALTRGEWYELYHSLGRKLP